MSDCIHGAVVSFFNFLYFLLESFKLKRPISSEEFKEAYPIFICEIFDIWGVNIQLLHKLNCFCFSLFFCCVHNLFSFLFCINKRAPRKALSYCFYQRTGYAVTSLYGIVGCLKQNFPMASNSDDATISSHSGSSLPSSYHINIYESSYSPYQS